MFPGLNLYDTLNEPDADDNYKQQIQKKINSIMNKLHDNFITHGDFKRTNFIVSDDEPYVTDLDSMKVHIWGISFKRRKNKDTKKLRRMFS